MRTSSHLWGAFSSPLCLVHERSCCIPLQPTIQGHLSTAHRREEARQGRAHRHRAKAPHRAQRHGARWHQLAARRRALASRVTISSIQHGGAAPSAVAQRSCKRATVYARRCAPPHLGARASSLSLGNTPSKHRPRHAHDDAGLTRGLSVGCAWLRATLAFRCARWRRIL